MALVYPIDYLQDIVFNYLSTLPQLDANEDVIPNTFKYPLFTNQNIVLENQDYILPDLNAFQTSDNNPFFVRILTAPYGSKTLSRGNIFTPLPENITTSTEEIVRNETIIYTFIVFSYKPNIGQNGAGSLFNDPTSAFYKWHTASNVIYDIYNALLSGYAQNQSQVGNFIMMADNQGGIRNTSFAETGQIQERFQFDLQIVYNRKSKKVIDNYNQVNTNFIIN